MGGRPYCPHTSTITRYVFERSTRSVDVRRAPAPAGHHSEFLQTVFFYLHDITVRSVADLNSTTLVQRQTHGSQSTPVQSIRHTFNVRLVTRSQLRPSSHRRLVDHGFWSAEIGRGAQSRVTHAACSLKSLTVDKRSSYLREPCTVVAWSIVVKYLTRKLHSESTNLCRFGGSGFRTLDSRIRSVIRIATKIVTLGP